MEEEELLKLALELYENQTGKKYEHKEITDIDKTAQAVVGGGQADLQRVSAL